VEIEILEEPPSQLGEYASVSCAFRVERVLEPEGAELCERPAAAPYWKDYDALPGNHPLGWPARFDLSRWCLLVARAGGRRAGGAALVPGEPAALWDLRVAPELRGRGVGSALLAAAEARAVAAGCRRIRIETQSNNVGACRLYAARGYGLESVRRHAYPELPDEIQLVWSKALAK
jgi:ribosomal protein S18 acetylase RimI-like enzyme